MTMRELLRELADALEGIGEEVAAPAAALRALADRWDAEEAAANRIRRTTSNNFEAFAAGAHIALLARLDAPPPVTLAPKLSRDHYVIEALEEMAAENVPPVPVRMTAEQWRQFLAAPPVTPGEPHMRRAPCNRCSGHGSHERGCPNRDVPPAPEQPAPGEPGVTKCKLCKGKKTVVVKVPVRGELMEERTFCPACATPPQPRSPDCLKPMTEEQRAAFVPISDETIAEALRKGAEARDRAMNPWKACAPWCGTEGGPGPAAPVYPSNTHDYCSPACRDARRPLNPRAAK